jgi:hypothetical protein
MSGRRATYNNPLVILEERNCPMLSVKKSVVATLLIIGAVFATVPAMADNYSVDITISNLGDFNLGGFDLDLTYDADLLSFTSYTLTDELGTLDDIEASDWSYGNGYTGDGTYVGDGTTHLSVVSWLDYDLDADFFSSQANDFVLASIIFSGDDASALNSISFSYLDLSDEYGDMIPVSVDGTNINAVPIPGAIWMALSGLLGIIGVRRRVR